MLKSTLPVVESREDTRFTLTSRVIHVVVRNAWSGMSVQAIAFGYYFVAVW